MSDTLYIKMDRSVEITHEKVTVGDIATLECKNTSVVNNIKSIKLISDDPKSGKKYIVSIMKIIELVDQKYQNVSVSNIGETECIVEFKKSKNTGNIFEIIKAIVICIILFFGAGFSIMSFNNDVSVNKMFWQISNQIAGESQYGIKIIQIGYSLGLTIGIVVFYNHFGPKKLTKDPTPIETEMRKYEDEINNALIDGHNRKDEKIDIN